MHPPENALNKTLFPKTKCRGIYAWHFKELPRKDVPTKGCSRTVDGYTLLYIGIAPSLVKGEPSKRTLRDRISQHYTGNIQGSTLRKSLACLLWDELQLEFRVGVNPRRPKLTLEGQKALTGWLSENALVSWVSHNEPWEYEVLLIHRFNTPLNIDCNHHHPFNRELTRTRVKKMGKARLGSTS